LVVGNSAFVGDETGKLADGAAAYVSADESGSEDSCVAVLEGGCNKWTRIDAGVAYSRALKDQGFNIGGAKIHSKLLCKRFGSFYHEKLLRKLDKFETRFDSNYFIKGGVSNPLENVLLQHFLE